jgi:uncharacterized repeat protein (TIGR03803 family)
MKRLAASTALALAVVLVSAVVTTQAAQAQTLTTLYSFCVQGGCPDGEFPASGLVRGIDGNLYGTLPYGGGTNNPSLCNIGCGTVFRITPTGELTTLYSFCALTDCADGSNPFASLVLGTDGNFYGTTPNGGAGSKCSLDVFTAGCGTVFRITPGGKLTTLYNFCSLTNCVDGSLPQASLIQAADGNFYGTTEFGGLYGGGKGTVFKITPSGTLTTLYSFCAVVVINCNDGQQPSTRLVQASNGDFYGTNIGGAHNKGTVFKITAGGTLTTLHTFRGLDGESPSGLAQANNGNLYGTTFAGGAYGAGTVFSITLSGALATLYSFCAQSGCPDGFDPTSGLLQATDGNLYGTVNGGANNGGKLFNITPSGTLTTLYSFCTQSGCPDGSDPVGLTQTTDGNFYGTTGLGGATGSGTVFRLSVGLGPFIEALPSAGKLGRRVKILGRGLKGATNVTFNGAAATFTAVSNSLIITTVPAGATTGKVQVVTPGGTLSSNVAFQVIP